MSPEHKEISEEQLRRRRINLYKKIIIGIVITLILLPTLLCIILFCKVNKLSDKLDDIKTAMDATEKETTDKVMESEPNSGNNKKPMTVRVLIRKSCWMYLTNMVLRQLSLLSRHLNMMNM